MKVLFIGGTGIISTAVSKLAVEKGMELYLLNRGNKPELVPEGAKLIQADIKNREEVRNKLKGHIFDSVVEWIGFDAEHVRQDIELFRGMTRQYIFISTASAYQKPPAHFIVDESTPLANPYWLYSRKKIECEELLMEEYRANGFPVTIVRPSSTYDKKTIPFIFNSRKRRWTLIDRMRKGKGIIVPGDGTSLWTQTHNSDFAKGFVGLIGNPQAIGHSFHITSDEVLTWNQIAMIIGEAAGAEPNIVHIPSDFVIAASPEHEGDLLGDKSVSQVFDNSKIKRFVPGFTATVPFRQGIADLINYYESKPELCTVDDEFNSLCDRIINCYNKGLDYLKQTEKYAELTLS